MLSTRLFLFIFIITTVSSVVSRAAQPFRVGVIEGGPHVLIDKDAKVPKGYAPVFFQKYVFPDLSKKFDLSIQWDLSPASRLLKEISKGRIDMMFMLIKTPEREKIYQYSAEPFLSEPAGLIVKKDFPTSEKEISPKQLKGKTVGQMIGTAIPDFYKENQITPYELSGNDLSNRLLSLVDGKRIDAVFVHLHSIAKYIVQVNGLQTSLKSIPLSEEVPQFKLYVVFKKNIDPAIKNKIEELIQKNRKHYPESTPR